MQRKYDGFVPGRHVIEGYGAGGFRFAGMSHRGSILATPSGIYAVGVPTLHDLDEQALAPVFAEPNGAVEILLLGTGASLVLPSRPLRDALKRRGVGVDPMATPHAVATYNILLGEGRRVAAFLLATP